MVHLQPLIDKIGRKFLRWFGKNIVRLGRVTLAKTVLTTMATYHQMVIPTCCGRFIKWTRLLGDSFGREMIASWLAVGTLSSMKLGRLGLLNLERFGRALRLRWPWL
jgi:hypothetical protein